MYQRCSLFITFRLSVYYEIARLLGADIDRATLSICVDLLNLGIHPDALASVVKKLSKDNKTVRMRREQLSSFDENSCRPPV